MTQQSWAHAAKPQANAPHPVRQLPAFLQRERLEPIFVVVTAVSIAASVIAERLNAPDGLILGLNILSYVAGGLFGLEASIKSLRHGEFNVDLLMVLAALGAAIVDQ